MKLEIYDNWDHSVARKLYRTIYKHNMTKEDIDFINELCVIAADSSHPIYSRFDVLKVPLTPIEKVLYGDK